MLSATASAWRSRRRATGRTRSGRAPDRRPVGRDRIPAEPPLRIAMLAPPWISVPPPGYGGVESVVSALTEALVRRGHDVTLFCAPGSVSTRTRRDPAREAHPDEIERRCTRSTTSRRRSMRSTGCRRVPLRRHPRPLRLHGARDGGPYRHTDRAHAARTVHA